MPNTKWNGSGKFTKKPLLWEVSNPKVKLFIAVRTKCFSWIITIIIILLSLLLLLWALASSSPSLLYNITMWLLFATYSRCFPSLCCWQCRYRWRSTAAAVPDYCISHCSQPLPASECILHAHHTPLPWLQTEFSNQKKIVSCEFNYKSYDQSPDFDDMSSFFPREIDDSIQYINLGYGAQAQNIVIL